MTSAHARVTRYLVATGWRAPAEPGPAGGLWRHPDYELLLPVPDQLVEGGLDWDRLVERLAQIEDASALDVLARLHGRLVDIANLRAANDIVIRDTIPYPAGVTMVRESWTMLRASATTSLGSRMHIRRYRAAADLIVKRARMAHTKRGSFIIPIHLALPDIHADETSPSKAKDDPFEGVDVRSAPESSERRVMRTFAEALTAIDEVALQPENEPSRDSIHDLVRAGVSHEFAGALHRVLVEEAVSEFSAAFDWAPGGGPAPAVPDRITVPAAAAERVGSLSTRLRTEAPARSREYLTGPIVGVHRDEETQAGTVTVQVSRNARLANVSVNVSRERLDEALGWMKSHETVYVESRVHRASHGLIADTRDALALLRAQHLDS